MVSDPSDAFRHYVKFEVVSTIVPPTLATSLEFDGQVHSPFAGEVEPFKYGGKYVLYGLVGQDGPGVPAVGGWLDVAARWYRDQ